MENSKIAWTHHTFNPWMGCTKVSDGCKHCYAEALVVNRMGQKVWGPNAERKVTSEGYWKNPFKWNRWARINHTVERVFCASLCDVFEDHPTANSRRPRLWAEVLATPNLSWLILTKRPENFARFLPHNFPAAYPNVWLGVSCEDMRVAQRVDILREQPAAIRFISYEPALGPLDDMSLEGIDWVIYGGESGPGHRPEDKDWARSMMHKCRDADVAFFHKQSSAPRTEMGILLDGKLIRDYPMTKRVYA